MTPPRKLDPGFRRGDIEWLMRSVFYNHNRFYRHPQAWTRGRGPLSYRVIMPPQSNGNTPLKGRGHQDHYPHRTLSRARSGTETRR